jgi:hypothetical protein
MTIDAGSLESNHIEITRSVCGFCQEEHPEWGEEVDRRIVEAYPEYDPRKGHPYNHPLWGELDRLWEPHLVPVIRWAYDDATVDVCARHLAQILAMLLEVAPSPVESALTASDG